MLVNLPYAYDDLFLPRMGSLTFAGRPCSTPAGGGGVGGMLRPKGEWSTRGRLILD